MRDRSLAALQRAMLRAISARGGVSSALPAEGGLDRLIAGDARLDGIGRLGIYADMYQLRLRAALEAALPQTARLCGEERFTALSADYVAEHPSRHPSLRGLGARFADFVSRADPPLADLARLEWARQDVFDEADEPLLDEAALRARGAEGIAWLPLRLVAAHRVVSLAHAVEPTWKALAAGDDTAPPPAPGPRALLVWREGISVYHRRVEEPERAAIGWAAEGLPFGALCERLADAGGAGDDAPRVAGELLLRWTRDQLLVAP